MITLSQELVSNPDFRTAVKKLGAEVPVPGQLFISKVQAIRNRVLEETPGEVSDLPGLSEEEFQSLGLSEEDAGTLAPLREAP